MWDDIKDFIVYSFIFIAMALCVIIAVGLVVYGVWAVSTGNIPHHSDMSSTTSTLNATTSVLLVSSML